MSSIFRNQQWMKIIFAIVTIFVFVLYWNGPTGSRGNRTMPHVADDFAKVYDKTVTKTTLEREARMGALAQHLGLDLFPALANSNTLSGEAETNFAFNSLVFKHEADALQIEPMYNAAANDDRVAEAIKGIPAFQAENGQFDPRLYDTLKSEFLPSLGFTENDLWELVAEDLRMKKIRELLRTTFVIPPEEFRSMYTLQHQKIDASVVRFKLDDFAAKVQPTDDEIKKAFEQHLEGYKSDEKRGIKFLTFALSDADKKLTGKDRVAALQKITQDIENFTEALKQPDAKFDDVAAKLKITESEVPPFALLDTAAKIPQVDGFARVVFSLTQQNPTTEALQDPETGNYYIIHLTDVIPSKLLTLAEARPQVVEEIKNTRGKEAMDVQSREDRNKIQEALTAGKSFADATKALGLTVEVYPPASLADPNPEKEDSQAVTYSTLTMKEGDISEVLPTVDGAIIVHLDKREPIDPKQYETDRTMLEPSFDMRAVNAVFVEWLRKQRDAANIVMLAPAGPQGGGTPAR